MAQGIRSLLFVPGDKEKLISKALASEADAVILDLEDAVAPTAKGHARQVVREALDNLPRADKTVFVRINAFETALSLDDLACVIGGAPWGIVLPKCSGPQHIAQLAYYLDALEAREGLAAGSTNILSIATETAAATLALGAQQGIFHPRLWGLMWGSEDLAVSLGATANRDPHGRYTFPYQSARSQCLYAAQAAGVVAVDAVWTDVRDMAGLEAEADEGLRDGFGAKAAIHPGQASIINSVFTPSSGQIEWASHVIEALRDTGVAQLDGKMIDLAHKRLAERILQRRSAFAATRDI